MARSSNVLPGHRRREPGGDSRRGAEHQDSICRSYRAATGGDLKLSKGMKRGRVGVRYKAQRSGSVILFAFGPLTLSSAT